MRVVGEPLDIHDDDTGFARAADGVHDIAEGPRTGDRVGAVDIVDAHAHELIGIEARQREERLATRDRRDRQRVVLDEEEHRQPAAHGFGDGLHHLALLRGAVAQATQDHRLAIAGLDLGGDADGLQGVVADGPA